MKKGQVTIFIIIAVIVIISAGILTFTLSNKQNSQTSSDFKPIKALVDQCVKDVSEESVYFIALQGGYYNKSVMVKPHFSMDVPYYWYDKSAHTPELNIVEKEFSNYIQDNVKKCVEKNLNSFKDNGFDIETEEITSLVKISDNGLKVNLDYPIKVSKGDEVVNYKTFETSVNSNFKAAYDSSILIIEEQKKFPNSLPISSIGNIAEEKGFKVETLKLDNNTFLITLVFNRDSEKPFVYAFINEYQWKNGGNQTAI